MNKRVQVRTRLPIQSNDHPCLVGLRDIATLVCAVGRRFYEFCEESGQMLCKSYLFLTRFPHTHATPIVAPTDRARIILP